VADRDHERMARGRRGRHLAGGHRQRALLSAECRFAALPLSHGAAEAVNLPAKTGSETPAALEAPAATRAGLAGMHPASFGMVMATGIVSIASHLLGTPGLRPGGPFRPAAGTTESVLRWIALALLWVNIAFYFG